MRAIAGNGTEEARERGMDDPARYKEIIDNLYDGVYFVDRHRVITYWNKGAERITGYAADDVLGRTCRDNLLNHVTAGGEALCTSGCPLTACMADGDVREADVFLHHADGHRVPVLVRCAPLRDARGEVVGAVETFSRDLGTVSARRELRELRRVSRTDPLTGVGNRTLLEDRLRALIAVTVSIGVAPVRHGDDPEGVLRRADEAMYRSKRAGRDRVTLG